MSKVIELVIYHVDRLSSFKATVSSRVLEVLYGQLEQVEAPVLEHLSLNALDTDEVVYPSNRPFGKGLPALKELCVDVQMFTSTLEDGQARFVPFNLPGSLRKVVLNTQVRRIIPCTIDVLLAALQSLSGSGRFIQLLEIVGLPDAGTLIHPMPVILDNVQALSVNSYDFYDSAQEPVIELFRHIRAPTLESLPQIPISILNVICLSNPFPSLRHLTIVACVFARNECPVEILSGALDNLDHLEEIRFEEVPDLSSDAVLLFQNHAPRLISLTFFACLGGFNSTSLRSVVEARRRSKTMSSITALVVVVPHSSWRYGTPFPNQLFSNAEDDEWLSAHIDKYENDGRYPDV